MNQIFLSNAPWIVGRPALFEYALEDFLGELGRQRPWTRAHTEALLGNLEAWLEASLGHPAALEEVSAARVAAWLETLTSEERPEALGALEAFAAYLTDWGWLDVCPWSVMPEVQR